MFDYTFTAPACLRFGWGCRHELGQLAARHGRRALLVTGGASLAASGRLAELQTSLVQAGLQVETVGTIRGEPDIAAVDELVATLRQLPAGQGDVLVGIGGGSVIDLAKAAAAVFPQSPSASVREFLEGPAGPRPLQQPALPVMALPTTAGTGSEATRNAVVAMHEPPVKKSIRDESMIPRVAIVDPELTLTVPPATTAATGMDALTQLIESFLSVRRQPLPSALCLQGVPLAARALPAVHHDPASRQARVDLSHAALLSGLALANSGLGLAHGVAAALGAQCDVPHGLACAVMLPSALRFNRQACQHQLARLEAACLASAESDNGNHAERSAQVVPAADNIPHAPAGTHEAEIADAFLLRIDDLCRLLQIPTSLGELGVGRKQLPALVEGSRGNSLRGNPVEVTPEALTVLLENLL